MYNWFKINCIEYGWFTMDIGRVFSEASDFLGYDMPQKFLDKVFRVVKENTEEWLYLMDEPGARILHIYLENNKVHFAQYELSVESGNLNSENEAAEKDKCGKCEFDMDVDIKDAVDRIVTEFSLYENGNGRLLYEEHWGKFPEKEFEKLKEYAFQLQKNVGEYDDLFCTTYMKCE